MSARARIEVRRDAHGKKVGYSWMCPHPCVWCPVKTARAARAALKEHLASPEHVKR